MRHLYIIALLLRFTAVVTLAAEFYIAWLYLMLDKAMLDRRMFVLVCGHTIIALVAGHILVTVTKEKHH